MTWPDDVAILGGGGLELGAAYEHVGRLEVAVDDGRVGRVEEGAALGDVLGDFEHEHVPALVDHRALRRPLVPVQELEEVALHAPTHHQALILRVTFVALCHVLCRVACRVALRCAACTSFIYSNTTQHGLRVYPRRPRRFGW